MCVKDINLCLVWVVAWVLCCVVLSNVVSVFFSFLTVKTNSKKNLIFIYQLKRQNRMLFKLKNKQK